MDMLTDEGIARLRERGRADDRPRPAASTRGRGSAAPTATARTTRACWPRSSGLGYRHVGWDVDHDDWEPGRTAAELVERRARRPCSRTATAAVVLLHSWPDVTAGRAARACSNGCAQAGADWWGSMNLARRPAVLAVDGGNSKLDAVLLSARRRVLGAARGRGASFSPQRSRGSFAAPRRAPSPGRAAAAGIDPERGPIARCGRALPGRRRSAGGRPPPRRSAARPLGWATRVVLRNDTFAVLRAGTDRTLGRRRGLRHRPQLRGRLARPAGSSATPRSARSRATAAAATGWACRRCGRPSAAATAAGRRPCSSSAVPAHFGMRTPCQLMEAIYLGTIDQHRLTELPRLVLRSSRAGDAAAAGHRRPTGRRDRGDGGLRAAPPAHDPPRQPTWCSAAASPAAATRGCSAPSQHGVTAVAAGRPRARAGRAAGARRRPARP